MTKSERNPKPETRGSSDDKLDFAQRSRHGLRRQSAAAPALSGGRAGHESEKASRAGESGVALRFPPQSKTRLALAHLLAFGFRTSHFTLRPSA
jgi:hypothetical protein